MLVGPKSRVRSRVRGLTVQKPVSLGTLEVWSSSQNQWILRSDSSYVPEADFESAELIIDEIHPGPPYKTGGPFAKLTLKAEYPLMGNFMSGTKESWAPYIDGLSYRYRGGHRPPAKNLFGVEAGWDFSNPDLLDPTLAICQNLFPDPTDWVTKAWSRTKPQLQQATAFVALAEGKDIPRMLHETAKVFHGVWKAYSPSHSISSWDQKPKEASDAFLNHQFGWRPFLSDLSAFAKTFDNAHAIIAKLTYENGKTQRRRKTLSKIIDEPTVISWTNGFQTIGLEPQLQQNIAGWTNRSLSEYKETHVRAVGAFSYFRPEFDRGARMLSGDFDPEKDKKYHSLWNTAMRQATIYGLRVNPTNIYKAIPWTWAIDWMSNFGDYIDRMTDMWFDSIAADYCYLMMHQHTRRVLSYETQYNGVGSMYANFVRSIDTKQRISASSPYGFALTWDDLTPRQLAIAGALGISRI